MVYLYHYTDDVSYHSIMREERIVPSSPKSKGQRGQGGRYGYGVYLTDMDPQEFTRKDVAKNNYGRGWETNINKTTHHICLKIPENHHLLARIGERRKWIFRGEITSEMFQYQGSNVEWDPKHHAMLIGGVAVICGVASLAGAYAGYKEEKLKEEERKSAIVEDRQKAEVKVALQMLKSSSAAATKKTTSDATTRITEPFRYMKHVRKDPFPADYFVSWSDVGTEINQYFYLISMRGFASVFILSTAAYYAGHFILVQIGSCYACEVLFFAMLVCIITFSFIVLYIGVLVLDMESDSNKFNPEIHIRNCIKPDDDILFHQKRKHKPESSSWFQKAWSWMAGDGTVSNIHYEVSMTKAGLARIATISFPLAAYPMIARKYYWISVLGGEWQAVTLYHYVKRNTSASKSEKIE